MFKRFNNKLVMFNFQVQGSSSTAVSKMGPFAYLEALFLPLIQGTSPSSDTNDETPFLPLTPTLGPCSSH